MTRSLNKAYNPPDKKNPLIFRRVPVLAKESGLGMLPVFFDYSITVYMSLSNQNGNRVLCNFAPNPPETSSSAENNAAVHDWRRLLYMTRQGCRAWLNKAASHD